MTFLQRPGQPRQGPGEHPSTPPAGDRNRGASARQVFQLDLPGTERLLGLSDGVVAIALTLLTLNLAVPSIRDATSAPQLASALGQMGNRFWTYLVAFFVVAQFWLAHHRVFRLVRGHDEGLAWWNFAFLLTITLMPFTSSLMGRYSDNPVAVDIFAANLLLASLATQIVTVWGRRRGLLISDIPVSVLRYGRARAAGVICITVTSIGVAWLNTSLAQYMWFLLAVVPPLAERIARVPEAEEGALATDGAADRFAEGAPAPAPEDPSPAL